MVRPHAPTNPASKRLRRLVAATTSAVIACSAALLFAPAAPAFVLGLDPDADVSSAPNQGMYSLALQQSNAKVARMLVSWSSVAKTRPTFPQNPSDPAYNWQGVDAFVRSTGAAGVRPMLSFCRAPAWAEGPRRPASVAAGAWQPNATQFGLFMRAVAKRYDGTTPDPLGPAGAKLPKVDLFQGWNEPNYQRYLSPKSTAIEQYRLLQNRAYENIKSVQPSAMVGLAGLAPYGSTAVSIEIDPQYFLIKLMCMKGSWRLPIITACPVKVSFDAIAFHPYTWLRTPTSRAVSPEGGSLGNAPDFKTLLDAAVKYKMVNPAGPKQFWADEFGWLTNPPGHRISRTRVVGISELSATAYTAETIYRLWSWKVDMAIWFSMTDRLDPAPTATYDFNWPGGLYRAGSTAASPIPKTVLSAFAFPTFASNSKLWAISPCRGLGATVTFQTKRTGTDAWTTVATGSPAGDGVVNRSWSKPSSARLFRATSSGTGCAGSSPTLAILAN